MTGSQKRRAHPEDDARTHPGTRVRNRRQTQADAPFKHEPPPIWHEGPKRGSAEEAELFYNVTVFGHELHLRLHPNTHLVAPRATMEWWEESGSKSSQPIQDTHCFYTGEVSNVEDTSVAISNCDGLVGVTWTPLWLHHQWILPSSFPINDFLNSCSPSTVLIAPSAHFYQSFLISLSGSLSPFPLNYSVAPSNYSCRSFLITSSHVPLVSFSCCEQRTNKVRLNK